MVLLSKNVFNENKLSLWKGGGNKGSYIILTSVKLCLYKAGSGINENVGGPFGWGRGV